MTSPKHSPTERTQVVITSIEPNDVVLGRGNHIHIDGNTKFRQLVHARSTEYWSCQDNFAKDLIARQIVETVTSRGGRFLRKVRTSGEDQWELANKETVLVKVKQTFRDFSASHRKQQSAAAASKSHSSNTSSHMATAAAASMSSVSTSIPNSLLRTEGESSTTTTSTMSADQLPASLSRAALPSDFLHSRPSALTALPAPDVQELLLLRELRANELNRILSNEMLQQLSPPLPQHYSALAAQDRSLRSWLEQASLLHLLPPSSSAQGSSLLLSRDQQRSNLSASRQFHAPSSLSATADVSDLYRRLLQQRTEIPQRSIPSAASLLDLSSTASSTTAYQDALRQSLSVSRLLEEMSQQQPSQQLQQLLAQERQQVLPSFFQSSIASTIAPTDRIPVLNLRSSQARVLAANMGAMAALGERPSEGKEQSPQSERKTAPSEDDSSGSELNGTD